MRNMEEENLNLSLSDFYQERSRNIELLKQGLPTLIPFSNFPRLSQFIKGFTPGDHVLVTAESGVSKSKFTRFLVREAINYCNGKVPITIFLNSLEENKAKVEMTFVSNYLVNKYGIRLNYYELFGYIESPLVGIQSKIEEAILWVRKNLMDKIIVVDESNPYAFFKMVRTFLQSIGDFLDKEGKIVKDLRKGWYSYRYHSPHLVMMCTDTIDALQGYYDNLRKETVDRYTAIRRFSETFCRGLLCKKCGVISIMVSQQSESITRVEQNFKGKTLIEKLKPSLATVLSVKAIGQHATLAFGIFDPVKYKEYNYMDYLNLHKLKGNYRSLLVLKVRESKFPIPGEVPLIAHLDEETFKELPLPGDPSLSAYYNV